MATNFSEQMELGSKIETTFCIESSFYVSSITLPHSDEVLQTGAAYSPEASLRTLINHFNRNNEIRIC